MNELEQNLQELLKGIRSAEVDLEKQWNQWKEKKNEKRAKFYDALLHIYQLYGDCLQFKKIKLENIIPVIQELREDLGEDGLANLRRLHKQVDNVLRYGKTVEECIMEIFPGSRKITLQHTTQ